MIPVPPPPEPVRLDIPQRQSVLAIVFLAIRTVRQVGMVQIVLAAGFLVARSPSLYIVAGLVLAVAFVLFAVAALRWWRYTFAIVDGELQVCRGVLSKQDLTIPLERVQSVSLEQKLLHRPLSLVQISLDTAGTQSAEFTIDAIELPVAQALQRAAADHRKSTADTGQDSALGLEHALVSDPMDPAALPPPPEPGDKVVVRHDVGRVVQIALTQTPIAGFVLVGSLLGVGQDLGQYLPFDLPEVALKDSGWWLLLIIPLILVVGFVVLVMLNAIRVLFTHWNLTVSATPAGLRRDAGLLSTTSIAASIPRIQRYSVRQGVFMRLFGIHEVELHTIGDATSFAVPGCDIDQANELRNLALAEPGAASLPGRQVSPRLVFLRTRNTAVLSTIAAVGLYWLVGGWSLLAFVPVGLTWLNVRRSTRLRRWDLIDDVISDRHELLGWQRHEILLRKVNGVRVRQSLFERKHGLATVHLETAAGAVSIGMIDLVEANEVRDLALCVVETDHRPWM